MMKERDGILMYNGKRVNLIFEETHPSALPDSNGALNTQQQPVQQDQVQQPQESAQQRLQIDTTIDDTGSPETIKVGYRIGPEPGDGDSYIVQQNDAFIWESEDKWHVRVMTGKNSAKETIDKDHIRGLKNLGIIDERTCRVINGKLNTVFKVEKVNDTWEYTVVGQDGFRKELMLLQGDNLIPENIIPDKRVGKRDVSANDIILYTEDGKVWLCRRAKNNPTRPAEFKSAYDALVGFKVFGDEMLGDSSDDGFFVLEHDATSPESGQWRWLSKDEVNAIKEGHDKPEKEEPTPEDIPNPHGGDICIIWKHTEDGEIDTSVKPKFYRCALVGTKLAWEELDVEEKGEGPESQGEKKEEQ